MSKKSMSLETVAEHVAEAARLEREIKTKAARVGELKTIIREYATKVDAQRPINSLERGEKVEIASTEGVATISFVKDDVSLVKGANPRALTEVLAPATWNHLFREEVVLNEAFDQAYKLLPKAEQAHVRKLVQWKTPEPRVLLPK